MLRILIILFLFNYSVKAQFFSFPEEKMTIGVFVDPNASINESGLNYGVELGYEGIIFYRLQYESFSALKGNYSSFGFSIGGNIQQKDIRKNTFTEYLGVRAFNVYRNGGFIMSYGIESGIDFALKNKLSLGLRITYDYRNDQWLLNNDTFWRFSSFIKLSYKI